MNSYLQGGSYASLQLIVCFVSKTTQKLTNVIGQNFQEMLVISQEMLG